MVPNQGSENSEYLSYLPEMCENVRGCLTKEFTKLVPKNKNTHTCYFHPNRVVFALCNGRR